MPVPQHYITFSATGFPTVRVLLNDPPKITNAGSKWEVVDRPRRPGMTMWRGRDPVTQTVGVLFDGYADDAQVDTEINNLMRLDRPKDDGSAPPVVRVVGPIYRRDITRWVFNGISWGDDVIRDIVGGNVVTYRQDAVITLMEYVEPTLLEVPGSRAVATQPKTKPGPRHKFHTVQDGETLYTIAVVEYSDQSRWRDIADANNVRDPNNVAVGTRLRMPN